ncbi:21081_t:CDS:2, partial [Gigaspora margarita]
EPQTINKKKLELQDQLHQAQNACIEYGYLNVNKPAKDEYPCCSDYGGTFTNPKKSSMRTKNKNKRKH